MGQASNTIYGDMVAGLTLNAMKRIASIRAFAMNYLTDLSKYAVKGVNSIHVPDITTASVQSVATGSAFEAPTGDSSGSEDLALSKKAGNPFYVKRDENAQTIVDLLKERSEIAAGNILKEMDVQILKGFIGAIPSGQKVDFAGHATTADVLTEADFIVAKKALNLKDAPLDGRFCFIDPKHESECFAIANFISADKIGQVTGTPVVTGVLGQLHGFDVVLLNHIPTVDKAGAINATAAKNDSYPVIFGQSMAYMWAKQQVETMSEPSSLATADLIVPYTVYGCDDLEIDYAVLVCDKTTADPS